MSHASGNAPQKRLRDLRSLAVKQRNQARALDAVLNGAYLSNPNVRNVVAHVALNLRDDALELEKWADILGHG